MQSQALEPTPAVYEGLDIKIHRPEDNPQSDEKPCNRIRMVLFVPTAKRSTACQEPCRRLLDLLFVAPFCQLLVLKRAECRMLSAAGTIYS